MTGFKRRPTQAAAIRAWKDHDQLGYPETVRYGVYGSGFFRVCRGTDADLGFVYLLQTMDTDLANVKGTRFVGLPAVEHAVKALV